MSDPTPANVPQAPAETAVRNLWEGYELWKSGCELWMDYLSALPGLRSPADLMDLNTRFVARSLSLSGFASGELLKDAGLNQPLLCDEC
ncbi:hypothetical protein [Phenylobacterium sp.]|uniref:hypothetical protein n=1 Tax=Phenylobacterium sp. TaxID=1871053 RepID=UPI0035B2F90C